MVETFQKIRSAMRGNLGVMIVTTGLWTLAGNLTTPFLALYVLELGGSYVNIGEIFALGAVIKVIPGFLGGYLADKMGRKKIVYTLSYMIASVALVRAFAPDYRWLMLAAVLEAVFMGFREPSMSSIIGDSTDPENRAMGYALLMVGPQLVGILSPSIIGVMMDRYGVRTAMMWGYLIVFALGTLASLIRQRHLEETLAKKEEVVLSPGSLSEIVSDFRDTVNSLSKPFKAFLLADFIFTFALGLGDPYYVTYATEGAKLSASQWGFIMSLVLLVHCATLLLVASPSDEHGRVRFVLASMISWPITYVLYVYTESFLAVLVVRIAITLSAAVGQPSWNALFVDFCPKEHRGRFNALTTVVWSLLYGGGNYLGGVLFQNHGVGTPFLVAAAFMSVGAVIAVFTLKEPEKREE
ncbi:MAG TPA: MFS transporter [Candidatus Krumholzibacteriaceae bacterium]|nr:MFS transporter [Candidatus Krumholzibacteriaceae bacterium]